MLSKMGIAEANTLPAVLRKRDVLDAYATGIDQEYFNPGKRRHFAQTTCEIASLDELRGFW